MVDDNRAIFMFKDGAQAWEAKDYLVEQDRCLSVTIENKVYPGKGETSQVCFILHSSQENVQSCDGSIFRKNQISKKGRT